MIRSIASVLITLVLLSSCLLAGGFEATGVGVKAKGMGGAFRAIADDWTAAYYNPAGLAHIYDSQLGISSGFVHFRHELTPAHYYSDAYDNSYGVGVYDDRTLYNRHEIHSMPSFGIVARLPFWGESVLGLSAYQPFDNNLIWKVWESPLAYNDDIADRLHDDQLESDVDVIAFQVTLAKEISEDGVTAGLGIQLLRADVFLKNLSFRNHPLAGHPDDLDDRPFDKIPEFSLNDGSGYGLGFNLGLLWKVNEKTDVALTARIPFSISISGDAEFTFVMPKGNDYLPYYPGTIEYLFTNGGAATPVSSFETDLDLPTSFGVGLAYDVSEQLTVALDAEYTNWSAFEGFVFTYDGFAGLPSTQMMDASDAAQATDFFTRNLTSPVEWDNTLKVMLGASYVKSENMTLLGGVFMDQSPISSSDLATPLFVDPGDKFGINGGLLYAVDRWELGLAFGYISYSDDMTVSDIMDYDGDGIDDSFSGMYSASTFETTLSVNYRF